MKEFDIEKQIEKTLRALDDHQRAEASPFFYNKLQQRLVKSNEVERTLSSIWNSWQIALIAIFIFMNVLTMVQFAKTNDNSFLNSLANDYGINISEKSVQDYVLNN